MDHSFGASTVLHTPSPADRRSSASLRVLGGHAAPLAPLPAPSSRQTSRGPQDAFATPGRTVSAAPPAAGTAAVGPTTTKAVRFSPAHAATPPAPAYFASSFSPPTRLQGSPIAMRSPRSTPTRALAPAPSTPLTHLRQPPTASSTPRRAHEPVPLGRVEVASRLRVNACLFVGFWLSSRTHLYSFASGHLVHLVPSLDTPLHVLESSILLLLFYNIIDAMYKMNALSSLPATPRARPSSPYGSPSSSPRPPAQRVNPPAGSPMTPLRSSPKTRPSPAMSPSPTVSRIHSPNSPASPLRVVSSNPNSPSTPSSIQPRRTGMLGKSSLSRSTSLGSPGASDAGLFAAYFVRHSPSAMTSNLGLSVNSREDIDRLMAD